MHTDLLFYLVAIPAVILAGLGKGGLAGVGAVTTPLIALVIAPVEAAAIVLPILIIQDVVSVWAFRKTFDIGILKLMLPFAVVGIGLGWGLAAFTPAAAVELALGVISVVFALQRMWAERHAAAPEKPLPRWAGAICAVISGFTSQIAHAGAPPFQFYVLPKRLDREVLTGTTSIFFAAMNWIKVAPYVALGQFTPSTLATSAALIPLAVASTYFGVWVIRRLSNALFYRIIYGLLFAVGLGLIWQGVDALF